MNIYLIIVVTEDHLPKNHASFWDHGLCPIHVASVVIMEWDKRGTVIRWRAIKLKTDQNTCCICCLLSTSIMYLLWKIALIYILMFCISACALYVRTQQNTLCHMHLTCVTQALRENLRVGEKRNRMNTVAPIVLFNALDFKSLTVTQLNSIFVSLPISQAELNLGWAMGLSLKLFFVFFF